MIIFKILNYSVFYAFQMPVLKDGHSISFMLSVIRFEYKQTATTAYLRQVALYLIAYPE